MELLFLMLLLTGLKGGALKPGMTALLDTNDINTPPGFVGLQFGFVAVKQGGVLGWTNVQAKDNAKLRAAYPNGKRVTFVVGSPSLNSPTAKRFKAIRDGDGPQGGPFFRA